MSLAPWRVLARAEMTRKIAHGDRYLETRVFLADGRVMEQVNPGVPDMENDWREVGKFNDLAVALRQLRREGWTIQPPEIVGWRWRASLLIAIGIAAAPAAIAYWLLTR